MRARNAVDPHITYTVHFSIWEAAIAAGASLDELMRLEEYPKEFLAKLVAWYENHKMVELHSQDAAMPKGK